MSNKFDTQSETLDTEDDNDDISKLQNQNEFLNKELCALKSQLQTQEMENSNLKQEKESLQDKLNNYQEYLDSLGGDSVDKLKAQMLEQEKEIEQLNEFIQEDLINTENIQNEYENKISRLKNDLNDIEIENDQLKAEITNMKENYQNEIENCFNNLSQIRDEKEAMENRLNSQIESLQITIKSQQEKIDELDKENKQIEKDNEVKMNETIDKYTKEIKKLQNAAKALSSKSSKNDIDAINKLNSELTSENESLKAELDKIKTYSSKLEGEIKQMLIESEQFMKSINTYKNRICELEDSNDKLKSQLLYTNISEKDNEIVDSKELEELKKKNENIQKELDKYKNLESLLKMTTQFTYKIKLENKRLIEENKKLKLCPTTTYNSNNIIINGKGINAINNTEPRRLTVRPTDRKYFKFAEIQSSIITEKNSSNDKQIQFLTEQNKSYQKDIDTLNKSKNELMNKIKEIQSAKCGIEEQLISKEREIMKYRTLCNRLKLKIKEISSSK